MAKTQINFRIDEELLRAIQDAAEAQGISYTSWIINQCKISLRLKSEDISEGRIVELINQGIQPLIAEIACLKEDVAALKKNNSISF